MNNARRPRGCSGLAAIVSVALLLSVTGCGDHPEQSDASQELVKVRFRLPWVNATGRKLDSAEIRFHGLSYPDVERHLSDMNTPGLSNQFYDDIGNLTWVYRFADVEARATGVVEIEAIARLGGAAERLSEAELARYQGVEGLSDQEQSFVTEHREATCIEQPRETLNRIRALVMQAKEAANNGPSGDEVDSDDFPDAIDTQANQGTETPIKVLNVSPPQVIDDERLAALMGRACGLATRSIIGVEFADKVQAGANVRIWNDIYLDGNWEMLLEPRSDSEQTQPRLIMRVLPDAILANDAVSLHRNMLQTVGVSVDTGAVQITLAK